MLFKTPYQKKGYPILESKKTVSFTKTITKSLFGKEISFYSSTPTIVEYEEGYLLNVRWLNYSYHEDGSVKEWPKQIVNLNSRMILDKEFTPLSDEEFLQEEYEDEISTSGSIGLEDIRVFKHMDDYYYTATFIDTERRTATITSGLYNLDTFELPLQPILPSFYSEKNRHEKNWSFVHYKNKMAIVYAWYPLQLTEIDYENNQLNRLVTKTMPEYFKEARGSTPGYKIDKQIWFVIHKRSSKVKNNKFYLEYEHCFVIFDVDMNLLRYSEWFRLGNRPIEFCIGLIVTEKEVILSYSLLDTETRVSVYDVSSLLGLKWIQL